MLERTLYRKDRLECYSNSNLIVEEMRNWSVLSLSRLQSNGSHSLIRRSTSWGHAFSTSATSFRKEWSSLFRLTLFSIKCLRGGPSQDYSSDWRRRNKCVLTLRTRTMTDERSQVFSEPRTTGEVESTLRDYSAANAGASNVSPLCSVQ